MYTSLPEDISKLHVLINLACSVILSVFVVVNLSLDDWFQYCYWKIGLIKADSSESYFSGENSIKDAHDDACDSSKIKDAMQELCPDLCDNLKNAELAGGFFIAFSVLTMIGLIFVLLLHILLLCKKKVNMRCAWLLLFVPLITWLGGFILYCSIIKTSDIRSTNNPEDQKNPLKYYEYVGTHGSDNFEMKGGMIFAIINIIFFAAHLAHGLIFTRKYL